MFLKIHYIFFIIFLIFSSNIKSAPDSNSISKDEKDARFTESTEELIVRAVTIDPATHPGNLLYQENCAGCHNGTVEKAPATNWLEALIPQALFRTMNQGIMMEQSSHLTEEEKILIVEFLMKQNRSDFPEEAELNYCSADKVKFDLTEAPEPYGWGYNLSLIHI